MVSFRSKRSGSSDEDAARPGKMRRGRPSTLKVTSASLLLGFFAVVCWLAIAGPPESVRHEAVAEEADQAPEIGPAFLVSGMTESGPYGPLPKIHADGRKAWQVFASPFEGAANSPRIAILVSDYGLNAQASKRFSENLPGAVSFALSPYSPSPQESLDAARSAGHEVVLQVPLEPLDYPDSDPGPHTLLTTADVEKNTDKLAWIMSRAQGYTGVMTDGGSKFSAERAPTRALLETLNQRGLMVIDDRASQQGLTSEMAQSLKVPRASINRVIDEQLSAEEIAGRLAQLERIAESYGAALGLARPYAVSMEQIRSWAETLPAKGIELVPVTAVANRQPIR